MKGILVVLILSGVALAQTPTVSAGGVLNAASFDTSGAPVAPGSLISIFGSSLSAGTATADSIPLSTNLGNVTVSVNGIPTPLYYVTHTPNFDQINAQLPWNAQAGAAQVVVTNNGTASAPQSFQVGPFAPGIFSLNGSGTGQAIAVNYPDYSYAAPSGSIPGLSARPAVVGDPNGIIIYATGLGAVSPEVPNGAAASGTQISTTTTVPVVMVGGVAAQVTFSGLAPGDVGVNQINAVLAQGTPTGSAVPLQIQIGGMTSTSKITIAVSQ